MSFKYSIYVDITSELTSFGVVYDMLWWCFKIYFYFGSPQSVVFPWCWMMFGRKLQWVDFANSTGSNMPRLSDSIPKFRSNLWFGKNNLGLPCLGGHKHGLSKAFDEYDCFGDGVVGDFLSRKHDQNMGSRCLASQLGWSSYQIMVKIWFFFGNVQVERDNLMAYRNSHLFVWYRWAMQWLKLFGFPWSCASFGSLLLVLLQSDGIKRCWVSFRTLGPMVQAVDALSYLKCMSSNSSQQRHSCDSVVTTDHKHRCPNLVKRPKEEDELPSGNQTWIWTINHF